MNYSELVNTGLYKFYCEDKNGPLILKNRTIPISIMPEEFDMITKLIIENNCKRGYEIATGFGISALAAGLGFSKTGGKLVTLDAYIEENYNLGENYHNVSKTLNYNSDGYKSIWFLINKYSMEKVIFPKIGWSPDDVYLTLKSEFDDIDENKLDYVFIDGDHRMGAVKRDVLSIKNYVDSNTLFLFHDMTGDFRKNVNELLKETFGKELSIIVPYPKGFDLAKLI